MMSLFNISPPWTLCGKKIESLTRKALIEFDMLCDTSHIAVALSGGKDSISLLAMLAAIRGRGFPHFQISALHVDGEFSCGAGIEKPFIQAICHKLNIPLYHLESKQKREELACYSCARERRSLLFHKCREIGAKTLAFGHHRDDAIETLLLNLFHKAEFASMLPKLKMHAYGVTIIRPLIFVQEEEILTFAKRSGFHRITCQCPVGQDSQRKKVKTLIALIEEKFPHVRSNLFQGGLVYGSTKAAAPTTTKRALCS